MAYSRPPVQPGRALKRTPAIPIESSAGVFDFKLDADIATTDGLGVIQVGSGLSITPSGVLSATNTSNNFINVTLTGISYSVTANDSYVGATSNNITITLPLGITGRVYYIKNQSSGNIKVRGTSNQLIDSLIFQTLGSDDGFMVVFDGSRWNIL
jgi:hypothetical protein